MKGYKVVEKRVDGYAVYSVGVNLKDDGGDAVDEKDVVFTVAKRNGNN